MCRNFAEKSDESKIDEKTGCQSNLKNMDTTPVLIYRLVILTQLIVYSLIIGEIEGNFFNFRRKFLNSLFTGSKTCDYAS